MSTTTTIKTFALLAIGALVERALSVPQEAPITPIPVQVGSTQALAASAAPSDDSDDDCNLCNVVADVKALVFYSEVFLNPTATELVSIGAGNGTGSRTTKTSIIQNSAQFTFDPERMGSAFETNVAITPVNYASEVVVDGATLTSPTAYNVYSAYAVTSAYRSNGQCVTTSGSKTAVNPPYSEVLPSASGRVTADANGQDDFIQNYLNFKTCSGGGVNRVESALVPVAAITTTSTTTGRGFSLGGQSLSIAPTTNPTSTGGRADVITLTEVMESTTVTAVLTGTARPIASASAPIIVASSTTITPAAGLISLAAVGPDAISAAFGNATEIFPTGTATGTGVGNYSVVPFLSGAEKMGGYPTVLWGTLLAAIVLFAGLL